MKKCPYCAEEIQDDAIKCKHCQSMMPARVEKISERKYFVCYLSDKNGKKRKLYFAANDKEQIAGYASSQGRTLLECEEKVLSNATPLDISRQGQEPGGFKQDKGLFLKSCNGGKADITLTRTIALKMPFSESAIRDALQKILCRKFNKFKFLQRGSNVFVCRIKTRLFNPIVSLKGDVQMQSEDLRLKIMIVATTGSNGWFWFTALFFLICSFGLGFLLMFWMYHSQKKASTEALGQTLEQLEFELGKV